MGKKCSACSKKNDAVMGFEDAPYTEIASAIAGGYAAGKIDAFLRQNSDGTPKTGMLAENTTYRAALLIAAGVGLTAYMKDDISKGAGIGLATFGGYQLIEYFMNQAATNGVNYVYVDNENVNGNKMVIPGHNSPGSYGYAQSNINSVKNQEIINKAKAYDAIVNNQMKINDLVREKPVLKRM